MIEKVWLFFCSDSILNKFDIGELMKMVFTYFTLTKLKDEIWLFV